MSNNQQNEVYDHPQPPKKIEDKPKGMIEDVKEIKESLQKLQGIEANKGKDKQFKMPWGIKSKIRNPSKMMNKNIVLAIILKESGDIETKIANYQLGMIIVGDYMWNGEGAIYWRWQGKVPTVILCEWDIIPISKQRLVEDTDDLKTYLNPIRIGIRMIEAKQLLEKQKGKFNPMMFIIGAVVLAVGYFIFFGGG